MSSPELSVVCKSCGSEVSPYVTECPYCGTRLRKRAPKLERRGDELAAAETRKGRRSARRRARMEALAQRPYATIAAVIAPSLVLLAGVALSENIYGLGAIAGPVGSEWWRYITAPFAYADTGYLFVVCLGVVIFGSAVERRLGTIATVMMILACGGLGMLAADGIEQAIGSGDNILIAAGGNGIALGLLCAWAVMRAAEVRRGVDEEAEVIGAAIAAAALVLLPLVDDSANIFAGLVGALVGASCGLGAALARGGAETE
ncbi:MAG: rhomboid family intramembrane serine protease [Solirubrobacterales bacterium]|nr:rhomboid family intramembrane serine protease [Solirubrobacterales bacterium]